MLAALLLATGLVACTGDGDTPSSPTTTPAPAPTVDDGIVLDAGDLSVVVHVLPGASVAEQAAEDGSTRATVLRIPDPTATPSPEGSVTLVRLAPPDGASATVLADGSVTFADAAGTLVGGLAAPTGQHGAALVAAADGLLDLTVPDDAADDVVLWLTSSALLDAQWGDQEGGRSLSVTPAAWTRAGGLAEQDLAWAQLVAREPEADSTSMHDQLVCHMLGAPTKDTWNLEPWRPAVDLVTLVSTKCNPTEADAG